MNDTTGLVIATDNLSKSYGKVQALNALTLEAPYGAIGLLGPNGAGKSTLLKILLGLTDATSGAAQLLGADVASEGLQTRQRVGYMPETDCLPGSTTAADFVGHMAEISGLPSKEAKQRAADVLYQVGMDEERYRLIGGFSTGMKQRVKLAQAIVHDPLVLFLDEPTAGLDPQGREEMLVLIQRIHRQLGMTVVFSSHILEDIERVCDFVVILDHGVLKLAQPIDANRERETALRVEVDGDGAPLALRLQGLGFEAAVSPAMQRNGRAVVTMTRSDTEALDMVRDLAAEMRYPLRSLSQRSRTLEELYLAHVGDGSLAGETDEHR